MPTNRLNLCVVLVAFGWAATASARPGDGLPARPAQTDSEAKGEESAIITGTGEAAAQAASCLVFGGFDELHAGRNRYRGNAYRMEYDAKLLEIRMELSFVGEVDLYFSIHRAPSEEDVPYERVVTDCVARDESDDERYESCTLPLTLEAGFDYLIGVTWGQTNNPASRNVTYGRDVQTYPLPFLHGQILGLVADNTAPPLGDTLAGIFVFDSGAYSMELCFEPVEGACCVLPDAQYLDGCKLSDAADCVDSGGWFQGQRVSCDQVYCDFGACCDPCGDCYRDYTHDACAAADREWQGSEVDCDPSPCVAVTGACCLKDPNRCEVLCARKCDEQAGTYRGDGTMCDPDPCQGACCVQGGCINATPDDCDVFFGIYKGDGTSCAVLAPELECGGACCYGFFETLNYCQEVPERSLCTFEWFAASAYWGDGTICPPNPSDPDTGCGEPVDYGACCLPDGLCINTTLSFCEAWWVGGQYRGGIACNALTCTTGVGACCMADGTCELLAEDDCTGPGGQGIAWTQGQVCVPNNCPAPTGACCMSDASCTALLSELECDDEGGLYEGDDPSADPCTTASCEPFGACCRPNGTCTDRVTKTDCEDTLGGSYKGDGTTCDSLDPNCPRLGACCTEVGDCFFILRNQCDQVQGASFLGGGITCQQGTCPTGVCCVGSYCIVPEVTRAACDARLGDYRGDGSVCSDETIICGDIEGACCMPDETCQFVVPQVCFDDGGDYQGEGVLCQGDVCTLGACCPPDFPDGDCVDDVLPLKCDADGGEWYPGVACLERPCDPTGACCNGGDCAIEKEVDCLMAGGIYQGDDIECLPGLCTLGACCHLDGTCEDGAVESTCTDPNTDFYPNGDCNRDCYPRGACCKELECVPGQTRQLCESDGGTYDGDGTVCREELCDVVACCFRDGCSYPGQTRQQCEMNDGVYLPGASCEGAGCTRGACCRADGTCTTDDTISVWCEDPKDFQPGATCNDCVGRGVCCVPEDPLCDIMTQEVCQLQHGGRYGGDATTCEPSDLCRLGACCTFDERCDATQTGLDCELAGGIYLGSEAGCDDDAIDCVRGACCELDGTCLNDTVAARCTAVGSEFHSMWTCEMLDPPCAPKGACCKEDVCFEALTQAQCENDGGTYDGDGTVCREELCSVVSCCFRDGCSYPGQTRQQCEMNDGVYLPGTSCEGADCTRGACCRADGTCAMDDTIGVWCEDPEDFQPGAACNACVGRGVCCVPDDQTCYVMTREVCEVLNGGMYGGDATTCEPSDMCQVGACCRPDETCIDTTRLDCETDGYTYVGSPATCQTIDCALGACCELDGTCRDDTIAPKCAAAGSEFYLASTCETLDPPCQPKGACCNRITYICQDFLTFEECQHEWTQGVLCADLDPPCAEPTGACCDWTTYACQDSVTLLECQGVDQEWTQDVLCAGLDPPCAPTGACCDWTTYTCQDSVTLQECQEVDREWTQDVLCADLDPPCVEPAGACCLGATCSIMTESQCANAAGSYQGDDTLCEPNPCQQLSIVSSDPPDCALDARQPSKPDGSEPAGWSSILITCDGDTSGLTIQDFSLEIPQGSIPGPPADVIPSGNDVTVVFPEIIPTGEWSCVVYDVDGTKICLGYLPANVNGDTKSAPADILYLIDCLNGVRTCESWQCDVDRSERCGPPDILRVIDLLNGAGSYDPWLNLPIVACPTGP
ncbi:MAG: hypothetical protein JSU86_13420 [Phycisphaerales bacterium]|nr:MAG: hypothetical protein JSU86_13420 [Phycisphaerales bacterium]